MYGLRHRYEVAYWDGFSASVTPWLVLVSHGRLAVRVVWPCGCLVSTGRCLEAVGDGRAPHRTAGARWIADSQPRSTGVDGTLPRAGSPGPGWGRFFGQGISSLSGSDPSDSTVWPRDKPSFFEGNGMPDAHSRLSRSVETGEAKPVACRDASCTVHITSLS